MKAIFLDIDGVLNGGLAPGVLHWNSTLPDCVEKLNNIITSTGAKVFVISSWVDDVFFVGNNQKLAAFLYDRGVLINSIIGFRKDGLSKEEGILKLIQDNVEIDTFIIIDDNDTIVTNEFLKSRHIITESLDGLTDKEVTIAITMLNEQ